MAKKSNVHLKTVEHVYGLSGAQPCGHLSADEMNDLIEQIKNAKTPYIKSQTLSVCHNISAI